MHHSIRGVADTHGAGIRETPRDGGVCRPYGAVWRVIIMYALIIEP